MYLTGKKLLLVWKDDVDMLLACRRPGAPFKPDSEGKIFLENGPDGFPLVAKKSLGDGHASGKLFENLTNKSKSLLAKFRISPRVPTNSLLAFLLENQFLPVGMSPAAFYRLNSLGLNPYAVDKSITLDEISDSTVLYHKYFSAPTDYCLLDNDLLNTLDITIKLARRWKRNGVIQIAMLMKNFFLDKVKTTAWDVIKGVFAENFITIDASNIRAIKINSDKPANKKRHISHYAAPFKFKISDIKGRVVFFIATLESFRYKSIIMETAKKFSVAVVCSKRFNELAFTEDEINGPIIEIDFEIGEEKADNRINNEINSAFSLIPARNPKLSKSCKSRHIFMANGIKHTQDRIYMMLRDYPPILCCFGLIKLTYLTFSAEGAALRAGLPRVMLPNGSAMDVFYGHPATPFSSVSAAVTTRLQEKMYKLAFPELAVTSFAEFNMKNEYVMENKISLKKSKPLVLMLLAGVQARERIYWDDMLGFSNRIEIFRDLYRRYLAEFSDEYDLLFKLHPAEELANRAIYLLAGIPEKNILPLDSNLGALLAKTSVAVSFNYIGSPSLQAIQSHVPLISFQTFNFDHFTPELKNQVNGYPIYKILKDHELPMPVNLDEFFALIKKVLHDPDLRGRILANQQKLLSLLDGRGESWNSWLEKICVREAAKRKPRHNSQIRLSVGGKNFILGPDDLEKVRRCPFCGSLCWEIQYISWDRGSYIQKCQNCGLFFSDVWLSPAGLKKYWSHYLGDVHQFDKEAFAKRQKMYQLDFDYIKKFMGPADKVLEVGCSEGLFLDYFHNAGHICDGVEFGGDAARVAARKYCVFQGNFPDLPIRESYDLIIFRGVLLYVHEPARYLEKALSLLGSGGLIYITAQPNMDSLCHKVFREKFSLHLCATDCIGFSKETLNNFFAEKCQLIGEHYFYEETPYANPAEDVIRVGEALEKRRNGEPILKNSPPFWGNMMTLVYKKL